MNSTKEERMHTGRSLSAMKVCSSAQWSLPAKDVTVTEKNWIRLLRDETEETSKRTSISFSRAQFMRQQFPPLLSRLRQASWKSEPRKCVETFDTEQVVQQFHWHRKDPKLPAEGAWSPDLCDTHRNASFTPVKAYKGNQVSSNTLKPGHRMKPVSAEKASPGVPCTCAACLPFCSRVWQRKRRCSSLFVTASVQHFLHSTTCVRGTKNEFSYCSIQTFRKTC